MIQGVVLAAGLSTRAGKNKMLLPLRGRPLVEHAVLCLAPFAERIVVVTGHYRTDVEKALAGLPAVRFVHNPDYRQGMFSSVRAGVAAAAGDLLILPGDIPLIRPDTIAALLAAEGDLRVPVHRGLTGHPLFLAEAAREALLAYPGEGGLRGFRDHCGFTAVPVPDPGILTDVDTVADWERLDLLAEGGEPHAD